MVKEHKSQDYCVLSQDFRGTCEVTLLLWRSLVWKSDKVHYADLCLTLSHEICENKITSQIVAFITRHLGRHLFKYFLSGSISKRSKKDSFFFFLSLWLCFSFFFSLRDDESTKLAVIEGKAVQFFNWSTQTGSLSVRGMRLPQLSLSFM